MEGLLQVPPDRGTIIGRAIWKPRYVVVGAAQKDQSSQSNRSRNNMANGQTEAMYLSIYKAKSDWEPLQMYPLSAVTDCQVQMVSHRKQGPVLPTLVINIAPDPAADKLRKRRSSRTAGLTSSKEPAPTSLWFRPGDEQHSLQDWWRCVQAHMQPNVAGPLSPITPGSPTFINPFAPRSRDAPDHQHQRPTSGNQRGAPLSHKTSSQTQSSRGERERPVTYSESPSLRSRRSDLSHASSLNPSHMGFGMQQGGGSHAAYGFHPADLPSPATTVGEYQGEFIEGWTSAQGRASTMSSPVRGRDSVSSQTPHHQQQPSLVSSSSPPAPRETILDRAFQLKCIPGAGREVPGEEKLTSLARFDALMREADQRRLRTHKEEGPPGSAWDHDDDSDPEEDDDDGHDDRDDRAAEGDLDDDEREAVYMSGAAQQALEFITNRHEPHRPSRAPGGGGGGRGPPASHAADGHRAMNSGYPHHLRPQTGYGRSRPATAQRKHSQPQLAAALPTGAMLDVPSSSSGKTSEDGGSGSSSHREKRQSASSAKRLSFTEFTKRLSSTSSLLLVQTNASGGSSRGSSEADAQQSTAAAASSKGGGRHHHHHHHSNNTPRATPAPPAIDTAAAAAEWEKKCGWRGSVGVFGAAEGGFL